MHSAGVRGKTDGVIEVTDMKSAALLTGMVLLTLFLPPAYAENSKILFVNSYHQGYGWSDDIEKGLLKALGLHMRADGSLDAAGTRIDLRIFRMDTKRHQDEAFQQKAALAAKQIVDDWQPDVVVTSDDNAARYLIAPFFKDAATPFVFCGLNWDASVYGFPYSNVTGMLEVSPILEAIEVLKAYAKGERIGYLGADTASNRKEMAYHDNILGIHYADGQLVADFEQWKNVFLRLQGSVDMLFWQNAASISGWDMRQAEAFIHAHTRIPTGSLGDPTIRLGLLGLVKIAEEQGWWAGKTALRILAGTAPSAIPIVRNTQSRVYLNMKLAHRLGIEFPMDMIEKATFIEELPLEGN